MDAFLRYLRTQLADLHKLADKPELAETDFDDTAAVIREAVRRADHLGFGQWTRFAACEQLAPVTARRILAEMISATEKGRPAVREDAPMTVAQAAKCLSVSPAKIRGWIQDGRLAAIRVGRSHRITHSALEAMVTKPKPFTPKVPRHYST